MLSKKPKEKTSKRSDKKATLTNPNSSQSSPTITLWIKITGDDYDGIPIEVDTSISIHELKKFLQNHEELDLINIKLYLIRLYKGGEPLNVRSRVYELLQNNDDIDLRIALPVGGANLLSEVDLSTIHTPRPSMENPRMKDVDGNHEIKKEVVKLRKQLADLTTRLDPKDENWHLGEVLTEVKSHLDALQQRQNDLGNMLLRVGAPTPADAGENKMPSLLPTTKAKETLTDHGGPISTLVASEEFLFSGSTDMTVKVWELNTLKVKHTFTGHTQQVTSISKSHDNKMICSGSSDCSIKVWDVENLSCLSTINTGKDTRSVFVYRGMVFSGHLKTVMVWDIKKKKMVKELPGQDHWVRSILVANGYCFTAAQNIQIWDMGTYSHLRTLSKKCGSIYCLGLYEDWILSGTYEQKVLIWDTKTYENVGALRHPGPIYALAINGQRVYTGCYDHTIYEWDLRMLSYPALVRSYNGHSSTVDALCMVNDRLFSGSADCTIKTWRPVPN